MTGITYIEFSLPSRPYGRLSFPNFLRLPKAMKLVQANKMCLAVSFQLTKMKNKLRSLSLYSWRSCAAEVEPRDENSLDGHLTCKTADHGSPGLARSFQEEIKFYCVKPLWIWGFVYHRINLVYPNYYKHLIWEAK